MPATKFVCLGLVLHVLIQGVASIDYGAALTKSILFYEGQRSGKLPSNQRLTWRGDSGVNDGSDVGIDLVGGYYDAGDNVKFGFPMAYTITMLAWSVSAFGKELGAKNELENALEAIKWGTDYIIKAHPQPNVLYAQVGDGDSDHRCWQRPEDMTTPRTTFKIDEEHPGADLAAETAAALAASAVAFRAYGPSDGNYTKQLLTHATQLFEFAKEHRGLYSDSIPEAKSFYGSSDEQDELLWAAIWLLRATHNATYYGSYIDAYEGTGWIRNIFSWDDKYVGVQLNILKLADANIIKDSSKFGDYKTALDEFVCNCIQKGNNNVKKTPGGLIWFKKWNNLQYTSSAAFVAMVYARHLTNHSIDIECADGTVKADELVAFAKSQVDYILGSNPKNMSYMVGFGSNYPTKIHHRGASIVSIKNDSTSVTCQGGYDSWYSKSENDPNVLEGAMVGGPDENDEYTNERSNYIQAEPATANNAPLVGLLAKIASLQS
ncbi:hypothetical protein AQUCO_03700054v1 [Aquilegia coerulea]|uniref:Endoglucanase n=1 Tax=Aquilegia coerulea TaxID=218851 RepID=A0A2G5CTA2_AQUCA|nr:hypothetical protein AQUCO_03700054v1 [Aquilegia coerulea]